MSSAPGFDLSERCRFPSFSLSALATGVSHISGFLQLCLTGCYSFWQFFLYVLDRNMCALSRTCDYPLASGVIVSMSAMFSCPHYGCYCWNLNISLFFGCFPAFLFSITSNWYLIWKTPSFMKFLTLCRIMATSISTYNVLILFISSKLRLRRDSSVPSVPYSSVESIIVSTITSFVVSDQSYTLYSQLVYSRSVEIAPRDRCS